MQRHPGYPYLLTLLVVLLASCGRLSSELSVVGRNFADEVQQTQNLTFTLNKNIASSNLINEWDSTQYVRFVPAVPGKFKWTAPNELVFSPAIAFDPATNYRAELTDALLKPKPEKDLTVDDEVIEFHTPYLQLAGTERWWAKSRETGKPVAKLRLTFNYPVNADEVSGKSTVVTDDKPVATQAGVANAPTDVLLTLTNVPSVTNEQPLIVRIDKGIKVPKTSYVSKEPIEETTTLPAQNTVEVADVQIRFDGSQGIVRVITTQELQTGTLSQYYSIQPEVQTTAELTENGFVIRGNFNETDTYVLTLTDQIRGTLGAKLTEPVTRDLFFGRMPASLAFANPKAVYLSEQGARNVGLNIVNVPVVQVKIAKLYENNLLHYFRTNRYEQYSENADGNYAPNGAYSYDADSEANLSRELVNKTVETINLPKVRGVSALNIALPDVQNGFRGIYLVTVGSKNEAYLEASQLVSVSDIGLIAHQTDDEVVVWANSIKSAEPLQNVEINLISSNNQSIYTLKTDGSGMARFDKITEKAPGFTVALVTARTDGKTVRGSDFNFLFLPDTEVETSRFAVEGKRDNSTAFDAFVYGDRDIYRPGETIHFNTVIRSQDWQPASEIPVLIKLLAPNGREVRSLRKTTNKQGAVDTETLLDPAAVTGTYTVEVQNANAVLLTSQSVSVEEFVPDRIKVDVLTDRTDYQTGQTITLSATATNLFGPPATDRSYETELRLSRKVFSPKGFEQYSFDIPNTSTFSKDVRQGKTNANGQFTERFPIPATYQDIGMLEGKLFITVFDENGRPVNRLRKFSIQTQPTFFGVQLPDSYVTTNTPIPVEVVAVTGNGSVQASATALVEVVRFDYQTVIEKEGNGQVKYTTKKREKPVYTNSLAFKAGRASFQYVPAVSGEYEIRVRRSAGANYAATNFYAYSYGSTTASSFEVSQEGEVLMTPDKATYAVGETAKVLFKTPFEGKLLVTIERNSVLEQKWLTTKDKSVELSLPIDAKHLPNVYLTATLIRPIDGLNLPLTVAHGFASLSVQDNATKLPVQITAATASRSKRKQTIKVKTARNAQVTVAIVDEGILSLKNFQTPDPHGFFYQKRALEVGSHDLYALLYPELPFKSTSSVGGDGYDLERRVNPLSNGRVKLVALWSGILETGLDGEAEFTVDIPQFSGNLRIMAIAYKGNAFGSSSSNMNVADPIVISTGLPRFLSPGDQVIMPVTLSNTTKKPATITARLSLTGPLVADSSMTQQLTVAPGKEGRVLFSVSAKQAIGIGAVTITANGLKETFTDKTEITIRPAASLQKTFLSGAVAGGKTQTLNLATGFLPGTAQASLTLSRSPVAQYGRELSFLLGYPHGCMEQTISKAFPQLYFADLTRQMQTDTYFVRSAESDLNPATNVRQAVQKLTGLQAANGGFSMWPGQVGTDIDPFVSAYALHFLAEAMEAGYEVPLQATSKAIDYLTNLTNQPMQENVAVYDETGSRIIRKMASRTGIYALYALSVAGKPNRSAMNYYKQNIGTLTTDSRYLLASAFYRVGDTRSYTSLLPKRYTDNTTGRETGGSYASPLRNLALVLDALVNTDRTNVQIPALARQLSGALKQHQYINTQEAAFAFLALGKLARQTAGSTATATISAGGETLGAMTKPYLNLMRVPTGKPLLLTANGMGNVYYFAQSSGVPVSGRIAEGDNGLRVRRDYLDRNGKPIATIRQNDLVVVRITLASTSGLAVDNVVVTDLLPAGLEVENPRLTEQPDMTWLKAPDKPDHFDLRDDRINFFTTATDRTKTFYYLARAVSKGRFILGPIAADAMYNGEYHSYTGTGIVTIR